MVALLTTESIRGDLMPTSQNGWPANSQAVTKMYLIPGTTRTVRLEAGSGGALLVHFASWFHQNIEPIDVGPVDDWGYASRNIVGGSELSNHASGTAIDLNATKHPLAAVGTFSPAQAAAIRGQLGVYGGCIRWGGDYTGRKDEMHFEINAPRAQCDQVAANVAKGIATDAISGASNALGSAAESLIPGPLKALYDFYKFITTPDIWLRIAAAVAGGVLLILVFMSAVKGRLNLGGK